MPTQPIQIRNHVFDISTPHKPGDQLDQRLADALNTLRAENIRNNLAKKFAQISGGRMLSAEQLAEFTKQVALYDAEYQFPLRGAPRAPRRNTLEGLIRELAEDRADQLERQQGKPFAADERARHITELSALPGLISEARRTLEAREQASHEALESLL